MGKKLYDLQKINDEDFKETSNHIIKAGENLFNKIEKMIKSGYFSTGKNFIFMGDFNDTYGLYRNNNLFYKRQLHWCSNLHTCCYSDLGSTMNRAGRYKNKSPGDYIISTLQVKNTYIPVFNYNRRFFIMISDDSDQLLNIQRLRDNPMSDHQPLMVELKLPEELSVDKELKEEWMPRQQEYESMATRIARLHSKQYGGKRRRQTKITRSTKRRRHTKRRRATKRTQRRPTKRRR